MIKVLIGEKVEIVDVANKFSNNDYAKKIKIFGITIYTYSYRMTQIVNEKNKNEIGFQKK